MKYERDNLTGGWNICVIKRIPYYKSRLDLICVVKLLSDFKYENNHICLLLTWQQCNIYLLEEDDTRNREKNYLLINKIRDKFKPGS